MHGDSSSPTARSCGFCGEDISDMPGARYCGLGCEDGDRASGHDEGREVGGDAGYGTWTVAFEQLHAAAVAGAPVGEVERLAAAELDELTERAELAEVAGRGWVR